MVHSGLVVSKTIIKFAASMLNLLRCHGWQAPEPSPGAKGRRADIGRPRLKGFKDVALYSNADM